MSQRTENYSGLVTAAAAHLFYARRALAANADATPVDTFAEGASHGVAGKGAFAGGCAIGNSRKMVFAPSGCDGVGLYDPETDSLDISAVHGEASAGAFFGAACVRGNLVVLAPHNSAYVGLFDPTIPRYTRGPAHGKGAMAFTAAYYVGANESGEDIVIFIPRSAGVIGIYNATLNTYSDGPSLANRYGGGALLPDNRVMAVPYESADVVIYDPPSNTVSPVVTGAASGGAVLTLDGRNVIEVPLALSRIYQTELPSLTRHAPLLPQFEPTHSAKFYGGAPALNGEVVMPPYQRGTVCVWTPPTTAKPAGAFREVGVFPTDNPQYIGAIPAYDGRIVFVPAYAPSIGLWTHVSGATSIPEPALRSPYFGSAI